MSIGSSKSRKTPRTFHVPPLPIQGNGGPRGVGTAAPLLLVMNSHARGEVHQTQEDGKMQKKHPNEVAKKGCGDCGQVLGGDIQMNREGIGGRHQEGRGVQIPWAAVGPVGQQLASGTT